MSWIQSFHISLEVWGGIFCAIAGLAICISKIREKDHIAMQMEFTTALLLWMDAVAWGMRGYPGIIGAFGVRASNFAVFSLTFLLSIEFTKYVVQLLADNADFPIYTWLWAEYMINLFGVALMVVNLYSKSFYYFDKQNYYHRADSYITIMIVGLAGTLLNITFMILNYHNFEKRVFYALMSYLVLPVVAGVVQVFYYGIGILNMAIAVSMLFIFLVWQIDKNRQQLLMQTELFEKEKELADMQQDIMLSQIQPHFLYNSLTAIAQLCEKKPTQAKKATIAFADYLRGNMDALNQKKPVPFEKELSHIESYMNLEQIRFGDQLEVVYDIETVDFEVPVLSVQPIVENAVKHGIKRKGLVLLQTQEYPDGNEIRVIDDGEGFDPSELDKIQDEPGRSHVGVENVRKRLREMCHGTLTYLSKPGEGTTVIIWIPKK